MGQDQLSGGVSVLCWLAAPVAMFYGNLQNLVIKEYNIEFFGKWEIMWEQAVQTSLSTQETNIYKGHEDSKVQHTQGVAVFMLEETSESIIGLEPMSAMQIVVRFRTSNKRVTLKMLQMLQMK